MHPISSESWLNLEYVELTCATLPEGLPLKKFLEQFCRTKGSLLCLIKMGKQTVETKIGWYHMTVPYWVL